MIIIWIILIKRGELGKSDNCKFSVGLRDILLTLKLTNELAEYSLNTLIGKMFIIRETKDIELSDLSVILDFMNIDELNIISISNFNTIFHSNNIDEINYREVDKPSVVKYIEVSVEDFIIFLNNSNLNFLEYNKNTLYIIRGGSYRDVKNIFKKINNCNTEIGRGNYKKSNIVSPLDFRLYSYIMAMFNFNYKLISHLNTFNYIPKSRYSAYDSTDIKPKITITKELLNIKNLTRIIINK